MLCSFLLHSKVNQLYACKYPLLGACFPFRSPQSAKWSSVCYTRRFSLVIWFTSSINSVYMLIPPSIIFCQFEMLGWRLRTVSVVEMAVSRLGTAEGFPSASDHKESTCHAGDLGSNPGQGKSLEKGMATHSSILAWRILMDRGAWRATAHGVTRSQTQLSD